MEQLNGYFQIEWRQNAAYVRLHPAKDGGVPVDPRELTAFLDSKGITGYNAKDIANKIASNLEEIFPCGTGDGLEFSSYVDVDISMDLLEATVRCYPPSLKGAKVTARDIMSSLQLRGIIFGIDQDAVLQLTQNPVYCTDIVIAKGKLPEHGHDAYVEYLFNTEPNTRPAHNEDGSVDFHTLDNISHVNKGDVLAILHPEDRGKPGRNVKGKETAPKSVTSMRLSVGRNITLSEDGLKAISDVTGHASLYNGQIFVSDVYEVPADVDNSTGDIDYNGNVHVKGSIREGFRVSAKGDIIVEGTIEGALVEAGGQIIIKRGINGMGKGVLDAGGNVISKFIENARVFSAGYVETGTIIHSEVSARGDVLCEEKKGFITGGVVKAGGRIEAQTIGSSMGASTRLEVGMDPAKKEQYNSLQLTVKNLEAEIAKILPVIQNYAAVVQSGQALDEKNAAYYTKLLSLLKSDQANLQSAKIDLDKLAEQVAASKNAKIIVKKDIHPGVTVVISDLSYTMKEKRSFCSLEKKDGEIVISTM